MEYLDVVDEQDRVIGREEKDTCLAKGLVHRGSATLVFRDASFKEILLARRSQVERNPGLWCHPGGHVVSGESYEDAAKREAMEELFSKGREQFEKSSATEFAYLFKFRKQDPGDEEWIAVYRLVLSGPFYPDPSEVEEVKFFKVGELIKDLVSHPERYTPTLRGLFERYQSWTKDGRVL